MRKTFIIGLFIILCLCSPALGSYTINLVSDTPSEVVLTFSLDAYDIHRVETGRGSFQVIDLKDAAYPHEIGIPDLPYVTRDIIIPDPAGISLDIVHVQVIEKPGGIILPSAGPVPRTEDQILNPPAPGITYQRDEESPGRFAQLGDPYVLRDFHGITVIFRPFLYNPVQQTLRIASVITVRIRMDEKLQGITPNTCHRTIPGAFEGVYQTHFLNYENYRSRYPTISEEGRMIVITTAAMDQEVFPFIEWKNRKGIPTALYLYPNDTGNTPAQIKTFIKNLYDSAESLCYILIVGDAEDVPPAIGTSGWANGAAADPVYTLLAGDDQYPDAFIGRFSVEDAAQAGTVIYKNLQYEMAPDPAADWYHKAAGIASNVAFDPYPEDWILMEGLRVLMQAYNYSEFTTIYDPGAAAYQVTTAINDGRGWVNYLGHGGPTGWNTSAFSNTHAAQLQNDAMTPVIISVACSNGDFEGQTCFAEAWQRVGTPEAARGSIVFMGSSVGQTTAAWVGQEEIIHRLVEDVHHTIGGLTFNGEMKAISDHPGLGNGTGSECVQSWHLFGDPSLFFYTDTPGAMTVAHDEAIPIGATGAEVLVEDAEGPIEGALVAFYGDGILYGSAYTDLTGLAYVEFAEAPNSAGFLEVNATAFNKIPSFGSIEVRASDSIPTHSSQVIQRFEVRPNPFQDQITLRYGLAAEGDFHIGVYDISGRLIRTLYHRNQTQGSHALKWDGLDELGNSIPAGIYFIKASHSEGGAAKIKCLYIE
ncbi:MAG: T9SS type A sorting domain-containing protein [Candidatus Eisenbacteria bacterium]|uniref:T9SS type A sorting domain-containing protein n=1 Tax=Eiseniibacteriota bacterium TaxID=2212470 RepID=A0A948RUB2_UNCEI|nr:T9SS type A sorting domain-containing protein [Candidatus Eisenbacteria bacterium]MBU2690681.1 T9SS type A sorting domain-containing protein [Candidatus Eisenbacteria bacterium]